MGISYCARIAGSIGVGVADSVGLGVGDGRASPGADGSGCTVGAGVLLVCAGRGVALPPVAVARGVGVGAGRGGGVGSPKPGGRIDSGLSWPIAGASAPSAIAPSATAAAPSRNLAEIRKRDGLFYLGLRLFRIAPGEEEQPADEDDEDKDDQHGETGHDKPCNKYRGRAFARGRPGCIARPAMMQSANPHPEPIGTRPIVLVGLMGVGKSTVGRRLATRLKLPFVDADHAIEEAAGMTIADIFERFGEPYFRDGERRVIQRLMDGKPKVIATGGGAFINDETRALILAESTAVWLDAPVAILADRVRRRDNRPLLRGRDPRQVLTELARVRNPIYALAPIHVTSQQAPHDMTVAAIMKALNP
jgi:shikimate kinase